MKGIDTSREAIEARAAWHDNEAGAWASDGANHMLARIHRDHAAAFRALLAQRDAALRDLAAAREALVADMYWMADDPERPESDPREHACVNGLCPGEYFEISRAVSLGNAWAVVIPSGDDDDIDCEVVETEDAAKRRSNEIRAALAAQPAAEGTQG